MDVFLYLSTKKYPEGIVRENKKTFRVACHHYTLDEAKTKLFYVGNPKKKLGKTEPRSATVDGKEEKSEKNGEESESEMEDEKGEGESKAEKKGNVKKNGTHTRQPLVKREVPLTEKKQLEIIEGLISQLLWLIAVLGCHNIAHPAADSTYRLVSKDYYWRGMKEHIFSYVSSCKSCQLSSPPIKKGTPKLRPVKPPKDVWSVVGIDLQGPFPETPRGNKYICVVKCYLSKFFLVRALPNKEAETVALEMYKIYCEFGFVQAYITDQGKEFLNKVCYLWRQFVCIQYEVV